MAHVTIEYMIMVPVLILEIFLFPFVATVIMDNWMDAQRNLELQDIAGNIGSSIQQLYYTISRADDSGTMQLNLDIPQSVNQYAYTVTFGQAPQVDTSYKVMNVTLQFISAEGSSSSLVTLGNDIVWQNNLSFNSTTPSLSFVATKSGGNVVLTLGGA
ncbi:MAG: hypothetical protein ACQCN4_06760 [Candidatus Bathyarchaeia archaeon]